MDPASAQPRSAIEHYRQRTLKGANDQYQPVSMTAQVADVKTTLGSVYKMLKSGNRVHFELGNCYIEDMNTGRKTKIIEKGSTFEVGIWVPKATSKSRQSQSFRRQDDRR